MVLSPCKHMEQKSKICEKNSLARNLQSGCRSWNAIINAEVLE